MSSACRKDDLLSRPSEVLAVKLKVDYVAAPRSSPDRVAVGIECF